MYIQVLQIGTEKLPFCPVTSKDNRVVTKHFTNLIYHKDKNLISLLGFLIYEAGSDNSLEYSNLLVNKYCLSVKSAVNYYNIETTGKKLVYSVIVVREMFKTLIRDGYLLNHAGRLYLNPMYSYRSDYISKKDYRSWTELYQKGDINTLIPAWVKMTELK
jgi:hypothetical protein